MVLPGKGHIPVNSDLHFWRTSQVVQTENVVIIVSNYDYSPH